MRAPATSPGSPQGPPGPHAQTLDARGHRRAHPRHGRRRTPTTRSAARCGRSPAATRTRPSNSSPRCRTADLEPAEGSAAELRDLNRTGTRPRPRRPSRGRSASTPPASPGRRPSSAPASPWRSWPGSPPSAARRRRTCAQLLTGARILTELSPVDRRARGDGDLEFVHPLIATAVYNSIPPGMRTAMHGIAAPGRHRVRAGRRGGLPPPPRSPRRRRRGTRRAVARGRPRAPRRRAPRTRPAAVWSAPCWNRPQPERARARALRTGLRHPPHLARHHHRPPPDRARRARPRRRRSASTPSSASPRRCSTTTSWRRPSARSRRRPPGTEPGPARMRLQAAQYMWEGIHAGEASSPGRSRAASPTRRAPARAGTTPSARCSCCAASTP